MRTETLQPIARDVLKEKYAKGDERTLADIQARVARALAAVEREPETWEGPFRAALEAGFIPAGRIMSAAGTDIRATLINCFVQPVGDAMLGEAEGRPGIMVALAEAAETMRRGGGVGYDFSPVRPQGARVAGTGSRASGPVSYMRVFDRMCETVESAGARRGAQMGILRCDHPDIETFVHAKDARGELTNFNLSVGVTDAFMAAVEADGPWELVHAAAPGEELIAAGARRRADGLWVYRTLGARELFDTIARSTYDHAEPGVFFIDRANAENPLGYCERLAATNPCVTGDTWVHTDRGPRQVSDLVGTPFGAVVNGRIHRTGPDGFFATGEREVIEVRTREGYRVRLTADHPVLAASVATRFSLRTEWVRAGDLAPGDPIVLHDHRSLSHWEGDLDESSGYLLGLLVGDGVLKTDKAVISVWEEQGAAVNGAPGDAGVRGIVNAALAAAATLKTGPDFGGWQKTVAGRGERRLAIGALRRLALGLGMRPGCKTITPALERTSSAAHIGFLRGLFDADGSVQGSQKEGVSVRLSQCDLETLYAVQRMLHRLGIRSAVYADRRARLRSILPDGKGGRKRSATRANHELVIANDNLSRFAEIVGFCHEGKRAALAALLGSYRRTMNRERFVATVAGVDRVGRQPVYDVTVEGAAAFDANGIFVHNCGEQPLPDYGCCCLGSLNLTRFVREPFTPAARLDADALARVTATAVRMLDNVLDLTYWPLPQQRAEAQAKRRVGLGFTGLGDALVMLGLRYDTDDARGWAADTARLLRDAAYAASVDLAAEKGAFPLFQARAYLDSGFARRLPEALRERISAQGLRNSHLLSVAPTGTISLAFADNASNGIEPPFSWTYTRRKRRADGGHDHYRVEDHAYRQYRELRGHSAAEAASLGTGTGPGQDTAAEPLPAHWVTALEISALDHMRMLEAVQPFVDAAISKTVNVPADYPFADFRDLYLAAWRAGLKGLSTFRPNPVTGEVLSAAPAGQGAADAASATAAASAEPRSVPGSTAAQPSGAPSSVPTLVPTAALDRQDLDLTDTDRRLRLTSVPRPALASLRWRRRPRPPGGNPAWTYLVDHPAGSFAIVVGHLERGLDPTRGPIPEAGGGGGRALPFEVWVNGAEQPRGLGALAKSLSMDMRSEDRGWLAAKLGSLMRARGDDAFELAMPPDGTPVRVPSLVAGFARLVERRCRELGAFDDPGPTPVLDALMSPKEPKTGTDGTLSWTVDLLNPATGDDFVMGVKELVLPDGSRRPYSVWLSGVYPRVLDGLCKSLSYDMRVIDPAWIGAKLRQLADLPEPRGDFLAWEPGRRRQRSWPSTVAYLVALLLHRFAMLGILDAEGYPLRPMGVVEGAGERAEPRLGAGLTPTAGRRCEECGAFAVIPRDGCDFCTACGAIGACG